MAPPPDAITFADDKSNIDSKHVEQTPSDDEMSEQVGNFETDQNALPPGYFTSKFFVGTMLAIGLGLFSGTAGFKFAGPVLTVINAELGPDPNYIWISLIYTLASAITLLLIGRISDIFGRRYVFISGAVCGTLGSIVCATAQSIPNFIGGMTLIGVGAATQLSYYYVMGELVPMKYRLFGNGFCYVFCIPGSFGPAISRAFIQYQPKVGWRGPYYVLIASNATALLCWVVFYHPPTFRMKHPSGRVLKYVKDFDWVGIVLYLGGALVFMLGLNWGGGVHPWASAHVIASIIIGFIALVAFVLWESFKSLQEPLMPMNLFTNRGWNAATIVSGVGASMFYAFAVVWPRMVSELYTNPNDLMAAALLSSIQSIGITVGEIISGAFGRHIGHVKYQTIFAFASGGALYAAMASCTPETRTRAAILQALGNTCVGYAEGLAITAVTLTARNQAELGTASGAAGSIRFFISSIAQTVYNVILSNRLATTTKTLVPPALLAAGLPAASVPAFMAKLSTKKFVGVQRATSGVVSAGLAAYKQANSEAFKTVFLSTIAFTGMAIGFSFLLPNIDALLSGKVAVTLGGERKKVDEEKKIEEA